MKPEEIASQLIALVETGNLAEAERRLSGITDAELQALPLLRMWEAFRKHAFKAGEMRVAMALPVLDPRNLSYRLKAADTFEVAGFASQATEQLEAAVSLPDFSKRIEFIVHLGKKLDQTDVLKKILDHESSESTLGADRYIALQLHTAKSLLAKRQEQAMYGMLANIGARKELAADVKKSVARVLTRASGFRESVDFLRNHFSLSRDEMDDFMLEKISQLISQNAKQLAVRELGAFVSSEHSADMWERCAELYLRAGLFQHEAVIAQKKAVSLAPRNGRFRTNLAYCHERDDRPFRGKVQIIVAYWFCTHTVETLRRSSEVAILMRMPRLALWFVRKECSRSSNSLESRIRLAYVYSAMGKLRQSESLVLSLLDEFQSGAGADANVWIEVLATLSKLQQYEKHDEILDRALEKFPRSKRLAELSRMKVFLGQAGAGKAEAA